VKIKRAVLSEDPMKLYETYSDRIFLSKDELGEYIKSQEKWKSGWKRGQQKKSSGWQSSLKTSKSMTNQSNPNVSYQLEDGT